MRSKKQILNAIEGRICITNSLLQIIYNELKKEKTDDKEKK